MNGQERRSSVLLWLRRVASYAVAVGIIWLLVHRVGVEKIGEAMRSADVGLLAAAAVISCVANTVFGADKWRRVVNHMGCRVSFWESIFIRLGAGPLRFIVPGKFGELIKPVYLQKHHGLPFVRGASGLVLDKMFNFWGVLFFLFLGIPFFGRGVPWYAVALPVAFVAGPIAFWWNRGMFYRLANWVHGKLHKLMTDLLSSFEVIAPRDQAFLFAYSILFQATEVVTFYLVCRAVGIQPDVPFHEIMVFVPLVIIVTQVPVSTSGLGVREGAVSWLLLGSGYGTEGQALCAGLLLSVVEYLLPAAIGIPVLPAFFKSLGGSWRAGPDAAHDNEAAEA